MEKKYARKHVQIASLLIAALAITAISMMFPAAFTIGGYNGIQYHGFPAGWMGQTTNGVLSITQAATSLTYFEYALGFIIDIIFWFCVAFILFSVTQAGGRKW